MGQKIKLDDSDYDIEHLSDGGKATLKSLQFATMRIGELRNMQALMQRAKNSYIDSLKREMLSSKAGLSLNDD